MYGVYTVVISIDHPHNERSAPKESHRPSLIRWFRVFLLKIDASTILGMVALT